MRILTNTYFNPHARVGRDWTLSGLVLTLSYFNPHARVGRDPQFAGGEDAEEDFNPHARVGRDQCTWTYTCKMKKFQSTRPRGA